MRCEWEVNSQCLAIPKLHADLEVAKTQRLIDPQRNAEGTVLLSNETKGNR